MYELPSDLYCKLCSEYLASTCHSAVASFIPQGIEVRTLTNMMSFPFQAPFAATATVQTVSVQQRNTV